MAAWPTAWSMIMTSPLPRRWYGRHDFWVKGRRMKLHSSSCWRSSTCALVVMLMVFTAGSAHAQATKGAPASPPAGSAPPGSAAATADPLAVPGFWDPRRRPERPDLSRINIIRFLTETDYPPFNYAGPDGAPTGFNVDLARMICEEIKVACTVQMRRFDTLVDALAENRGDAAIASMAATLENRRRVHWA